MPVTAKNLTDAQRAWAENYETVSGFEPLCQSALDAGEIDFDEFRRKNMEWLEDHHNEVESDCQWFPVADEELFEVES